MINIVRAIEDLVKERATACHSTEIVSYHTNGYVNVMAKQVGAKTICAIDVGMGIL